MPEGIDRARVRELLEREGAQLIEVLPEPEYEDVHLPGAANIPLKRLDRGTTAHLDKIKPIIVYCWDAL